MSKITKVFQEKKGVRSIYFAFLFGKVSKTFCQVYTICYVKIFYCNVTIEILDKLTLTKRGFHQNGVTSTFLPAEYTF